MTISDDTLDTDVFTAIRTKIVAAAPFVTNSSTSATTAASIRAAYNDEGVVRPQIIMNPIEPEEADWKFGSKEGKKFINIVIDCYYSNTLGIDQLAQQVKSVLKDDDILGIDLVGIATDYAFNTANDAKYQLKSLTFTYTRE